MKVLHVIASFGPGGAERQLSLIAPALTLEGVETHIAYCHGGPNLVQLIHSNVHLHALPSSGNHDPALAWNIFQLVRRLRPDVVQTWLLQMDILGGAAALLNRVPLVISERSSASLYVPSWKTRLRLAIGRRAGCIVANSQGGLDYWRPHVCAERLELIRNCTSLSADSVDSVDILFPHLACRQLVLFAGRFSYEKNIPVLIESLILVAQQLPDVAIMLFGEGPEQALAVQRITAAGMSNRIRVEGYSSNLAAWMRRAAVCVSVSHFEGHPNVAIEASVAGCPLVLSDIAAHRETFDDESARFVPKDSSEVIAKGVVEVLNNREDAKKRAARACDLSSKWDSHEAAAAYKSVYSRLLAA